MTSRLRTEAISVSFATRSVLHELSLGLPDGKVTMIIGPNACGKSTFLRSLARLQTVSGGRVVLDDQSILSLPTRDVARKLAILPQVTQAPSGMRVKELVLRGRTPHQSPLRQWSAQDQSAVENAIAQVGLDGFGDNRLEELSGGQRQRAWIAMTLAQQTEILLLDEPTTYLDLPHQIEVLSMLRRLCDTQGMTIAMVLHDVNLAARFSDNVVAMRDGAVVQSGPPDEVITSETMKRIFDLNCLVIPDPVFGTAHVIPK